MASTQARGRARIAVSAVLAAGLLAAGCGSAAPAHQAGKPSASTISAQMVKYADCMRSHGAAGFPDPQVSSTGHGVQINISPGGVNVNTPAFKSASQACRHLMPGGGVPNGGSVNTAQAVKFSVCMRSNGVPAFPDPGHDGSFDLPASVNPQSPEFQSAMTACAKDRPSSMMLNSRRPG
jgi:hypothetical protein